MCAHVAFSYCAIPLFCDLCHVRHMTSLYSSSMALFSSVRIVGDYETCAKLLQDGSEIHLCPLLGWWGHQ